MDSSDEIYGYLQFFRKVGEQGTVYPLSNGKNTIGSSEKADVRLKINDHRLAEIHCIIDVNDNGIATLCNKSRLAPVQVNNVAVKKFRVLNHKDKIELVGKKVVYWNENISKKDVERHEKLLNQAISTPSKERRSVTPLMKSAKKTSSLRTKTPTQRLLSTRKSFASSSTESALSITPAKKLDRSIKEKSKTTSKVIASKALRSPTNLKKRRLSLGTNPKSPANSSSVSARNILLSEKVASSTITKKDVFVSPKPSVSMNTLDVPLNKADEFLDESNVSLQMMEGSSQVESTSAKRRMSLRTPSKTSVIIGVAEATPVKLATPKIDTRAKKRITSLKGTPLSLKKVSPLYKSPPRVSRSARRLSNRFDTLINLEESMGKTCTPMKNTNLTLKVVENDSVFLSKKDNRKGLEQTDDYEENLSTMSGKRFPIRSSAPSSKKEEIPMNLISFDEGETFTKQEVTPSKSELSHSITRESRPSSVKRSQLKENFVDQYSPKTINLHSRPSLGRKRKISSIESDNLPSEESVPLNLSSNSSVSPIESFSSTSGDENVAPSLRKSLLRKSLRRSRQVHSSNKDSVHLALTDGSTPSTSGERQSQKPKPLRKSRGKLSLRKSNVRVDVEKEQEIDQLFTIDDSSHSNSPDKFVTKSKPQKEEQFEMSSSSEESLHFRLFESKSPGQSAEILRKSRQSLRKSNIEETQDKQTVQKEVGKQHMEERLLVPGSTNKLRQSWRKTTNVGIEEQTNMLSSSEESIHLRLSESPKQFSERSKRSLRKSIEINADSPLLYVTDAEQRILNELQYSSEEDSLILMGTVNDRYTAKVRHSSVRKSYLMTEVDSEEEVKDAETSLNKTSSSSRSLMNKITPSNKKSNASLNIPKQNISVITLNDSVDGTPENNTSVIIMDTLCEATKKSSHKRPSKTLNSTLHDDSELTTPKSAIRGRRSISLPYNPITEDITPVTPLGNSKNGNDFKTPLNTPGVFENIKKSVLKSRSRLQRSGTSLMDELNKVEPTTKAVKRAKESSLGPARSNKKRKVEEGEANNSFDSDSGDVSASFDSFNSEDILSDISDDQIVSQNTPKHFSNLTDKPVIIDPQFKNISSLEVPSKIKDSLFADSVFSTSNITCRRSSRRSSLATETVQGNGFSKKRQKSPKNDLSDVAGLKRLLRTPKDIKSPKNDLTDVKGVKKLFQTPKTVTSPRNDLTHIVGVKKLFSTPKIVNTPKNDLRNLPNLKKWVSPKQQNSPKNDLSDVAGLKKLMSTPKNVKSPKNDLRNVPNLKKWVSPKQENSPRNDLSDVAGLKKLLSTPKEVKSPKNDLTKVPNLRRFMSPKAQNSPKNDLSDVAGMKKLFSTPKKQNSPKNDLTHVPNLRRIMSPKQENCLQSNESAIKNDENLFDKLFVKKPLRTYRGKSASPNLRKAIVFNDHRKTVDDEPFTSPRVEDWVKEQVVIRLQEAGGPDEDNDIFEDDEITKKMKGHNVVEEVDVQPPKVAPRGRRKKVAERKDHEEVEKKESVTLKRAVRGRKRTEDKDEVTEDNENRVEPPRRTARGKRKVADAVGETPKEIEKATAVSDLVVDLTEEHDTELLAYKEIEFKNRQKKVTGGQKVNREYRKRTPIDEAVRETLTVDHQTENNEAEHAKTVNEVEGMNGADFTLPPAKCGGSKKTMGKEDSDEQIAEVHSTTQEIYSPVLTRDGVNVPSEDIDSAEGAVATWGRLKEVTVSSPRRHREVPLRRCRTNLPNIEETKDKHVEEKMIPIKKAVRSRRMAGKTDLHVNADEKKNLQKTNAKNKNEAEQETPMATEVIKKNQGRRAVQQNRREIGSPVVKRDSSESDTAIDAEQEKPKAEEVVKKPRGGRKKTAEEEKEDAVSKEVEPVKKTTRDTRRGILLDTDEGNEISDKSKGAIKRTGKSRKKSSEEVKDDENKETKSIKNTGTRGRLASKEVVESEQKKEVAVKITNKRTRAKVLEVDSPVVDSPRTRAKKGNFKKYGSDFVTDMGDNKSKLKVTEEEKEEKKSPEVVKSTGRSKKKLEEVKNDGDKETQPAKTTRTRRRPAVKKTEEPEEKEEVAVKATNKRKRAKVLEEEMPVINSPRTRTRKGSFKKYGSDFVTEIGDTKSESKSKKVHFEEVDVEEASRRPKRTRK